MSDLPDRRFEELCLLLSEKHPDLSDAIGSILWGERCTECGVLAAHGKCKYHLEETEE